MTSPFDLLIDSHIRNLRQGPGGDEETRLAIRLAGLDRSRRLQIADIGCGTGASSLVLATDLDAHIVAVDALAPFLAELQTRAQAQGVAASIEPQLGDMADLPFADESLDVIWSEGAIYHLGFAAGIAAWRRFLRPGGMLVVSEITWLSAQRPAELTAHWTAEYPQIATASANLAHLEAQGYRPEGYFVMPPRCWLDHYYLPLAAGFDDFLDRHGHSEDAVALVDAEQAEMDLYRRHQAFYSYGVYVARKV